MKSKSLFCYRLEDESLWLEGIDASRRYWIKVNGGFNNPIPIPGLVASSLLEWKRILQKFRSLKPQETMSLDRATIHCIFPNRYALEVETEDSTAWHLFDRPALESLLMTSHPDWQCPYRVQDNSGRSSALCA